MGFIIKYICDGVAFRKVEHQFKIKLKCNGTDFIPELENIKEEKVFKITKEEQVTSQNELPKEALYWNDKYKSWVEYDTNKNEWKYLWDNNKEAWWDKDLKLYLNKQRTAYILKTGISPVCSLNKIKKIITDSEFDDLLNGGIDVPRDLIDKPLKSNGMVILLTGSPGSGKTTFALELCYRLLKNQSKQRKINSLYITNEDDLEKLKSKLEEQIGGGDLNKYIIDFNNVRKRDVCNRGIYVIDRNDLNNKYKGIKLLQNLWRDFWNFSKHKKSFIFSLIVFFVWQFILIAFNIISVLFYSNRNVNSFYNVFEAVKTIIETAISDNWQMFLFQYFIIFIVVYILPSTSLHDKNIIINKINKICKNKIFKNKLYVAVVDSLNSILKLDKEFDDDFNLTLRKRFDLFNEVTEKLSQTFPISIIMMDTGPGFSPDHKWSSAEYMADLEINFSYDSPENYMIRRLWIVKSRYQSHADGFQRIKIDGSGNMQYDEHGKVKQKKYATSYFPEGGIHIFSSIHRYLSEARRDLEKGNENNKDEQTNVFGLINGNKNPSQDQKNKETKNDI